MAETPANSIALAVEHLRQSLANSSAVRTWMGVGTPTLALARIYRAGLPPPASNANGYTLAEISAYRPFIIVSTIEHERANDSDYGYIAAGSLVMDLEQTVDSGIADDTGEIETRFQNHIGAIMDDLQANSQIAGYLQASRIQMRDLIERTDPDKVTLEGDAVRALIYVEWRGL